MGWNVDVEPIDYLRRRVRYYQKKKKKVMKLKDNPAAQQYYGDELPHLIGRRLLTVEAMIFMFRKAVNDLQEIEDREDVSINEAK